MMNVPCVLGFFKLTCDENGQLPVKMLLHYFTATNKYLAI